MRWLPLLASSAIAAIGLAGCATSGAVEQEMSRLRREIHQLRGEVASNQETISRLEAQMSLIAAGRQAAPAVAAAPGPASAAGLPSLPVVRVDPKRRAAAPGEESDLGALDDGGPPVMIKLGPSGNEKLPVDHEVLKKPDPVLSSAAPPSDPAAAKADEAKGTEGKGIKAEYQLALDTLRERKQPAEARALLAAFRGRHPGSPLAINAAYWMAECSFAEDLHERAIKEFSAVIDEHPMSAKVPDALLRIGQSWNKLGQNKEAKQSFERVLSGYPGSGAAEEAERALRQLGQERR